jgi:hypothetical protein
VEEMVGALFDTEGHPNQPSFLVLGLDPRDVTGIQSSCVRVTDRLFPAPRLGLGLDSRNKCGNEGSVWQPPNQAS